MNNRTGKPRGFGMLWNIQIRKLSRWHQFFWSWSCCCRQAYRTCHVKKIVWFCLIDVTKIFDFLSLRHIFNMMAILCTTPIFLQLLTVNPLRIMCSTPWGGGRGLNLNPGGHLNVTWRGGAHFLRISTTRLGKKFAFRYPVLEFSDYKTIGKTIAYCSWKQ